MEGTALVPLPQELRLIAIERQETGLLIQVLSTQMTQTTALNEHLDHIPTYVLFERAHNPLIAPIFVKRVTIKRLETYKN